MDERSVIVTLIEQVDDAGKPVPWGLQLHADTLELLGCDIGSVAAENDIVRNCMGMLLREVNGIVVHTSAQAAAQMQGCGLGVWNNSEQAQFFIGTTTASDLFLFLIWVHEGERERG